MKHAFVHFETDQGVPRAEWDAFCAEHEIVHMPDEPGGNLWRHGGQHGVECIYGGRTRKQGEPLEESAAEVMFTTPWGGPRWSRSRRWPGRSGAGFPVGRCTPRRSFVR